MSEPLSEQQLAELEQLARDAGGATWVYGESVGAVPFAQTVEDPSGETVAVFRSSYAARHAAAMCPGRALALLAEVRRLRRVETAARAVLENVVTIEGYETLRVLQEVIGT